MSFTPAKISGENSSTGTLAANATPSIELRAQYFMADRNADNH